MGIEITKTEAYIVNMYDKTGNKLMSEDEVNRLIDDELGKIIDGLGLGHIFGVAGKLELHTALKARLTDLAKVAELVEIFADAKREDWQ